MGKNNWMVKVLADMKQDYARLETAPTHTVCQSETIMLPMPDGCRLYTVVHRPTGPGPFPTILMRSCYPDQEAMLRLNGEEYSRRGFAFVYQMCRGTGLSEGKWQPNVNERADGKACVDWLAEQDWTRSIGFWGNSYLALTGWVIADILPDKVKTLYLTHYGTDRFISAYQCGLFRQDVLTSWAMSNAGFPVSTDYQTSLRYRPQIEVDEDLWGGRLNWYRDWITNTNRQDIYWNEGFWQLLKEIPAKTKVPIYLGEGWYDHHLGSALEGWATLSEESKKHSVLRIGAWNHFFQPCTAGAPTNHLDNSDIQQAFAWFKRILCQEQKPEGCVLTYQINADRWLKQDSYPFDERKPMNFYLDASRRHANASTLSLESAEQTAVATYVFDPENPVPSHGAEAMLATTQAIGSLLQPPCGYREDVLSFVSDPLEKPFSILGKIQVVLYVASTADDTAFAMKLMEVKEDGTAYNIRTGITTLAYRQNSRQNRQPYEPGTVVEAIIDCWDICWQLSAGSRLRLDITSSDFPQYAIHSNFTGIWSLQTETQTARQSIYTGGDTPSRLILPVN